MKYWGSSETITSKTLQLLSDLSVGYSSVRKLIKLDAVQFILSNHTVCKIVFNSQLISAQFMLPSICEKFAHQ